MKKATTAVLARMNRKAVEAVKTSKEGFTLVEMMVVIAIIAVLTAIAVPSFQSALAKSKIVSSSANTKQIAQNTTISNAVNDIDAAIATPFN